MDTNQLQQHIMRRVYYSYVLSIVTHSMMWRGVFLGAAAVLLTQWLHLASIVSNFLAVPVGNIPTYVTQSFVNAATHGEMITVLTIIAATAVGLSCLHKMLKVVHFQRLFMSAV